MDTLLSPIEVGSLTLRNRVVSTAHGSFLDFYRPGEPPDRYVGYQERRARGGVGMIILQPIHVHWSSRATGHYTYEPDDLRRKLELMGRRLHAHDTPVLAQLLHFGAEFRSDVDMTPIWSFSGTVTPSGAEATHQMTPGEIEAVVEGFIETAAIVVEAGLDGIELSASHGYLLQQSFSPWANRRTDEWGQQFRFITAVIDGIRARIGATPVLGARISCDDFGLARRRRARPCRACSASARRWPAPARSTISISPPVHGRRTTTGRSAPTSTRWENCFRLIARCESSSTAPSR